MKELHESLKEQIASVIANDTSKPNLGNIDTQHAKELMAKNAAWLLDVRPPAKVDGKNAEEAGINNAYFMPYPEFADSLDALPEDKSTTLIVACNKGWFAARVMVFLELLGYSNVYMLDTMISELFEA